ncbi:hypothetical protein WOLCODRAFT_158817, partial [Wolfiporia cocos MD-104 SS10]
LARGRGCTRPADRPAGWKEWRSWTMHGMPCTARNRRPNGPDGPHGRCPASIVFGRSSSRAAAAAPRPADRPAG